MKDLTCQLSILVTSDVHGTVLPHHYANNQPQDWGLAKLATLIRRERNDEKEMLLIDNGDVIQGTPLTYHYVKSKRTRPHPIPLIMNQMGYDAAILGNHEFNYGLTLLNQVLKESSFPWLSCNILDEKTKEPYFGQPYLIRQFANGLKVAILGVTTPYIPNWEEPGHIEGLLFEDAVVAAQRWADMIRSKEEVDLLVVAYHGGFERDLHTGQPVEALTGENQGYELCQQVRGIDVLITGHQHRRIASEEINGVTVIQPGSQGSALGRIEVDFVQQDGKWKVVQKKSSLQTLESVQPDEMIMQMIEPYEADTQSWLDQPLGTIDGDMEVSDPMLIRTQDHPLIEFINRVQMEIAGVEISNTALFDNDAPGLPRHVTMRHIVANYIYPNTLKVLCLSGQDIKDALEQTATYFAAYDGKSIDVNPEFLYPKPQHYNYDMWEGIEYRINISRPVGERITLLHVNGKPIDLQQTYEVVMNNYRAGGGGNYFMFQNRPVIRDIPTEVSELLADYILQKGTIQATVNHNWKVIWDGSED